MVRTAQPLTLSSTNKQSASKRMSLGNGTLCSHVQIFPLPGGPQCSISQTPPPTPQLDYIIYPGGDGIRQLQWVHSNLGVGRVEGWFLPSGQRTRGGKRYRNPGGESRVQKDDRDLWGKDTTSPRGLEDGEPGD